MNEYKKNKLKISLFANEKNLLELLYAKIVSKISEEYLPKSSKEISKDNLDKMIYIDTYYQLGLISREMAIQIMSSIIECEGWINRFREYNEDLLIDKLKEITELLWLKRKNLFIDLEMGIITKEIFSKINSEISRFEKNNYVNNLRMAVIMDNPQNIEVIYNKSSK